MKLFDCVDQDLVRMLYTEIKGSGVQQNALTFKNILSQLFVLLVVGENSAVDKIEIYYYMVHRTVKKDVSPIPKKLHFIWLGPKQPSYLKKFMKLFPHKKLEIIILN